MTKLFIPFILFLTLLLSACGSNPTNNTDKASNPSAETASAEPADTASSSGAAASEAGMLTYQSENGPIEVPANPQRVVVLTRFLTGNVMALHVPVVGVDEMSKDNPRFEEPAARR